MKVLDSYFVELENGTKAWLAAGIAAPATATVLEIRPVIRPDYGFALRHKGTGKISHGHWMRNGDIADDWEEIDEPNGKEAE